MITFNLPTNFTENLEALLRKAQLLVDPPSIPLPATEPISSAPSILNAMAEKTLCEFSIPAITNMPVGPKINVDDANIKLKSGLIKMGRLVHFVDYLARMPTPILQQFLELCDTIIIKGVTPEVIRL